MAIDIGALENIPVLYPELISRKIYEDTILNRIQIETIEGAHPGSYKLRILDINAHLSACCAPYVGDDGLIETDAEVICLKDGMTYCETDFANVLRNSSVRYTAGQEDAGEFELFLSEEHLKVFLEAIDKLVFQGDTASADTNLNLYDGLIKQSLASQAAIATTATNLYDAFVQAFLALPEDALRMGGDIAIFVPWRWGLLYRLALTRFRLLIDNDFNDLNVPGLGDLVVIPTRGMDGSGQIFVTPLANIRYITNRREDLNTYEWRYVVDRTGDYYIWRVKAIFGVTLVIPEWSVVMTVPDTVAAGNITFDVNVINDPLNVNVTNAADFPA
jgi:hypothetical protein